MSFSKSILAFDDIRNTFDRALGTAKGIRIACTTRSAAVTLRSRFNYLRKLDRDESKSIYPKDHPSHGKSVYDRLILRIPPKGSLEEHILYIEPYLIGELSIEEIT